MRAPVNHCPVIAIKLSGVLYFSHITLEITRVLTVLSIARYLSDASWKSNAEESPIDKRIINAPADVSIDGVLQPRSVDSRIFGKLIDTQYSGWLKITSCLSNLFVKSDAEEINRRVIDFVTRQLIAFCNCKETFQSSVRNLTLNYFSLSINYILLTHFICWKIYKLYVYQSFNYFKVLTRD